MKTIDLYSESNSEIIRITTTNHNYNILQKLQYLGGFKRFGLDIYDEGKHLNFGHNDLDRMKVFLNKEFYPNVIDTINYNSFKNKFN